MTPPGWLVSVSDWPFKASEVAVDLSNWLRTLQLPQHTRDCLQMCNKIQFGLVLCKDVPTLRSPPSSCGTKCSAATLLPRRLPFYLKFSVALSFFNRLCQAQVQVQVRIRSGLSPSTLSALCQLSLSSISALSKLSE